MTLDVLKKNLGIYIDELAAEELSLITISKYKRDIVFFCLGIMISKTLENETLFHTKII